MNSLNIVLKPQDNVSAFINDITGGIEVVFSGVIQDKNPSLYLSSFFNDIHAKALEKSLKYIELNMTGLTFLNSSGIRCFIQWVTQIPKTPNEKKYYLNIKISKNLQWQENSFNLFKSIDPHFISIEKI